MVLYTQFVAGFEYGSLFWLIYSMAVYLFIRFVEGKPVEVAIRVNSGKTAHVQAPVATTNEENVENRSGETIPYSGSSIVPFGFFSTLAQPQQCTQPQEAEQVEQVTDEGEAKLLADRFLQLVQSTLGFTRGLSLTEQLMHDSILQVPTFAQPQVAEWAEASDQNATEQSGIATLREQIERFSIRQAKALARELTRTRVQIVGYGSLPLTSLIEQLTSPDRLQHIADQKIDISSLQQVSTTSAKKKETGITTRG